MSVASAMSTRTPCEVVRSGNYDHQTTEIKQKYCRIADYALPIAPYHNTQEKILSDHANICPVAKINPHFLRHANKVKLNDETITS